MTQPPNRFYEFGPFCVDAVNKTLSRNGSPLPLKPKAYEMLLLFVQNSGQLIDKDRFLDTLWHDSIVEEANITQTIYTLRKVLRDGDVQYIETIPKQGYRFAQPVRAYSTEPGDSGEPQSKPGATAATPMPAESYAGRRSGRGALFPRGWLRAIGIGLAITILPAGAFTYLNQGAGGMRQIRSIVVLPLKTLTASKEDQHLSLGITDNLIARLGSRRDLLVRAVGYQPGVEDANRDPVAIGRARQVEAVIDGSVQKQGDDIRVFVQMIDVKDGTLLWTDNFDRKVRNIFQLEDELGSRLLATLRPPARPPARAASRKPVFEAYEAYLKGRYHLYRYSGTDYPKALDYYKQAVALDPDFALAYAGLAEAYYFMSEIADDRPAALNSARQAAERALELDESLPQAHVSLGLALMRYEWDYTGAEQEFRRAVALQPNDVATRDALGWFLMIMGREADSYAELRRALELDPLSLMVLTDLCDLHFAGRRYDEGIRQVRKILDLEPGYVQSHADLGFFYVQTGRFEEAIEEFRRAYVADSVPERLAQLGYASAAASRREEALDIVSRLLKLPDKDKCATMIALTYAELGELDAAFDYLRVARERRAKDLLGAKVFPHFDKLRLDARFDDFLRSLNL